MAKKRIIDTVGEILCEYLPKNGYSLYHSEFVKEGRDWFLRVYIDKEDGPMSTTDCEEISRYLSEELDKRDPIEQNYYLVVSSPGLDRELVTKEHFEAYMGEDVDISLYKAIDGEKMLTGQLVLRTDDEIKILAEGGEIAIPLQNVAKTKLTIKF